MQKERANPAWLHDLRAEGMIQKDALEALRDLLLRAALFTLQRTLESADLAHDELLQIAEDSAQEALIAILERLDDFRGESKFTTWAYKFAINKTLVALRRERWKAVRLDQLDDGWAGAQPPGHDPDRAYLRGEIWQIIRQTMREELTARQRQVVELIVFHEVPMDVVVAQLGSNRNAIYQLLHDARRRLKVNLQEKGFATSEAIQLFAE